MYHFKNAMRVNALALGCVLMLAGGWIGVTRMFALIDFVSDALNNPRVNYMTTEQQRLLSLSANYKTTNQLRFENAEAAYFSLMPIDDSAAALRNIRERPAAVCRALQLFGMSADNVNESQDLRDRRFRERLEEHYRWTWTEHMDLRSWSWTDMLTHISENGVICVENGYITHHSITEAERKGY